MATAPYAHYMKEQEPVGFHGPPPPRYDQAMGAGHGMPYPPQPVAAPYPPQNGMGPGIVLAPQQYVNVLPAPQIVHAPQQNSNVTVNVGPSGGGSRRCPWCGSNVTPIARQQTKLVAHLSCLVMFLLGFWLCCFIPYCMNSCTEVKLKCPNCMKSV